MLSKLITIEAFEDGSSSLLLNINGALPVAFRGQTYGFPLSLWIPAAYPKHAPIIFICPTGNMTVRPGQHVSGEGRVYHPYLAGWYGGVSGPDACHLGRKEEDY